MFLRNNKIKEWIYSLMNILFYFINPPGASILMYHSIGKNDFLFNVAPDNFARQMRYLKDKNYKVAKLADIIEKIKNKEKISSKTVVITFDDGYKDNYSEAFSVLQENNFPATVFLSTFYIGGKFNGLDILNWREIKEMENSGLIDFGFHSHTHPRKMADMDDKDFYREVKMSKEIINHNISKPLFVFAYPKGSYNENQIEFLKKDGFLGAVAVNEGLAGQNDDIFKLKRNFIHKNCGLAEFKGKLGFSVVFYNFIKKII